MDDGLEGLWGVGQVDENWLGGGLRGDGWGLLVALWGSVGG